MKKHRQDAWSQDEDKLLAETVIEHIRTGSTQLKAFEEVGKQLSRTPAACGFRWNSNVRKLYKEDIAKAKQEKKGSSSLQESKSEHPSISIKGNSSFPLLEDILSYIQSLHEDATRAELLQSELLQYQKRVKELEKQSLEVTEEKEKIHIRAAKIESEYESLLAIMERARQLVLLQEKEKTS